MCGTTLNLFFGGISWVNAPVVAHQVTSNNHACTDTIWSGARMSGAVSNVSTDGITGSLANRPNRVVTTGMVQSDQVCWSTGIENVSTAPGNLHFFNVCARNCVPADVLGTTNVVNTTLGTSICGTKR